MNRNRIRPGITSYAGVALAGGLVHSLQALHARTPIPRLHTILETQFPDADSSVIEEIINQANNAKIAADEINSELFATDLTILSTWGYDPNMQDSWLLYVLHYIPVPTSWYTKLLELTGPDQPGFANIVRSIAAIQAIMGTPEIKSPTISGAPGVGIRDDLPLLIQQANIRLEMLLREAERGTASSWFQAAYDTAQEEGLSLSDWAENSGLIIAGVFRNVLK